MASNSQAMRLGYLLSPHIAFQGHAAHTARWPAMLSPNGSSGTCIPDGVYHIPMPCLHGATMPPVRPVREAFTSYGSRESGHLWDVSISPAPPDLLLWTACAFARLPLYCIPTSLPKVLRHVRSFLRSDYYDQFDCL